MPEENPREVGEGKTLARSSRWGRVAADVRGDRKSYEPADKDAAAPCGSTDDVEQAPPRKKKALGRAMLAVRAVRAFSSRQGGVANEEASKELTLSNGRLPKYRSPPDPQALVGLLRGSATFVAGSSTPARPTDCVQV